MTEQANLQVVQQNYAAFGKGDLADLLSRFSETVVWESGHAANVPFGGVWQGHEGVSKLVATIGNAVVVQAFNVNEFYAQGDTVIVLGDERAIAKSTGIEYSSKWIHVWTIQNGKVVRIRSSNDSAAVSAAFPSLVAA